MASAPCPRLRSRRSVRFGEEAACETPGISPHLERILGIAARLPWTHRLLRWIARVHAGRHAVAAVGALIVDGRVLVAEHRFRHGTWALVGGWVRAREDPADAVEREFSEEVGVAIDAVDVVACERQGSAARPLPYAALTIAFLCRPRDPFGGAPAPVSPELSAVRWIDIATAPEVLKPFEARAVAVASGRVSADPPPWAGN